MAFLLFSIDLSLEGMYNKIYIIIIRKYFYVEREEKSYYIQL